MKLNIKALLCRNASFDFDCSGRIVYSGIIVLIRHAKKMIEVYSQGTVVRDQKDKKHVILEVFPYDPRRGKQSPLSKTEKPALFFSCPKQLNR